MKISLMATCLGDVIRPEAVKSTVLLLKQLGHQVEFLDAQTCCGQPLSNSGLRDEARKQAEYTLGVFANAETIVCPSGSCAAMIKVEYPHLFEPGSPQHQAAQQMADRTFELTDFLVNHQKQTEFGAKFSGKVAVHYACHLRMLGLTNEVEQLVSQVAGAELVEIARQDQCCGFGGSFAVRYPEISTAMVDDKVNCLLQTHADVIVSTDTGCLMNIGGRLHRKELPTKTMHIAELLTLR
ncbi:MAG: (Fe-S)-binding protein [Pirellulales bacterium]|jgi:L-lactate dehydrogenase complex protein LldE